MLKSKFLHPIILVGVLINVAMLVVAASRSGADPAPLWALLAEDRIAEWMQFLCFTVTAGLMGFLAVDRWQRYGRFTLEVAGLLGVSVVVALAGLEEISWFQRVLGVDSPDFFRQHNRQAETNIHNLALGSGSIHKNILLKVIFLMGITHNLILPFLAKSRPAIGKRIEALGLYLPPLSAGVIYIVLVMLSHLLVDHPRKGELGEMFGAVHYLATVIAAYFLGVRYEKPAIFDRAEYARPAAGLFALLMGFLVLVAWILSAHSATGALAG